MSRLVSIIIPTYNRAESVIEAIRSAQRQTYAAKQIIVIDDGSRDETRASVEKLIRDEGSAGIEYYYQENRRQAAARNNGLKRAKGDYIATLDSDDIWDENFLSQSVACLEKNNLDFVFSSWQTVKNLGCFPSAWEMSGIWKNYLKNPCGSWYLLTPKEVRELFIKTCPAPSSSLLIRRASLASEWNTEMKIADDWCLVLDMVLGKPCRAAFTLRRLFTKRANNADNVYDGRSRKEVASELEISDTRLMKQRFSERLTAGERAIFHRRMIKGNLILAAYFVKDGLGIKRSLKFW